MEFFRVIDKQVSEQILQDKITPVTVSEFTDSMLYLNGSNSIFNGMTLWGEFSISFNKIKGGVRFTLLDCPNAFSWTITYGYPPERNKVILHCTINRIQKQDEFIEEINEFLDEWEEGLTLNL